MAACMGGAHRCVLDHLLIYYLPLTTVSAIIGLQGFFPLKGTAAVGVGAIEYPAVERKRLAVLYVCRPIPKLHTSYVISRSRNWVCPTCQKPNVECLPDPSSDAPIQYTHDDRQESLPPQPPQQDPAEKAFKILDAATATTIADPPAPVLPAPTLVSPPLIAPKPMRPIDASSIIIPATPSRPSTPLPPVPATVPSEMMPAPSSRPQEQAARRESPISLSEPPAATPRRSAPRPPILLDTAICVLLVSMFALICRRVL